MILVRTKKRRITGGKMKLNDVRVLRNIIGDKQDDGDEFLERKIPEFKMKTLDLKKMPRRDMYGRNLDTTDPNSFANPKNKKEAMHALGFEYPDYPSNINVEYKDVNVNTGGRPTTPTKTYDTRDAEMEKLKKEIEALEKRKQYERLREKVENYDSEKAVREKEREIKLAQLGIISNIMKPRIKEPGSRPLMTLDKTGRPTQAKIFGLPLRVPTQTGINRFYKGVGNAVQPRLEKLSYMSGGGPVGQFSDEESAKRLQKSIREKQSYTQFLSQKYSKKGYNVRNESDLMNYASDKEKARLTNLGMGVEQAQRGAATMGFMSGTSGRALISGTRQRTTGMNIIPMTSIGNKEIPSGSFASENIARFGVNRNLSPPQSQSGERIGERLTPENKWGVIFNTSNTTNSADRLTQIIGKAPSPGGTPRPEAKLDKYMKVFNTSDFNNKVKKLL
jgi:hypothetical protein